MLSNAASRAPARTTLRETESGAHPKGNPVPPSNLKRWGEKAYFPSCPRRGACLAGGVVGAAYTPYRITSSALLSRISGMVTPRAFAALRFTMNSNLTGRSIGMSPGLAPFRTFDSRTATRSIVAGMSGP